MPSEFRTITFEADEIYQAVHTLCTQKQIATPPPGQIKRIYNIDNDPARIMLEIVDEDSGEKNREEYNRDFIAGALMLYSNTLKIPLPRAGTKAIQIDKGKIILKITI